MLLAPSLRWGVEKSQDGPLRTNPGEFYLQKTLVLGVQDKTSLFWELRAPGFYLPREKAPSVEITFSAGKIRSDFRSGKCLGGKFLLLGKVPPISLETVASREGKRSSRDLNPALKEAPEVEQLPLHRPGGFTETRLAPEQQIARGKSRMGRGR